MGLFDRVERKLESAVNGAFARAFRAEVQPVEIASAMRRAMDDRAAVVGKGRTIVPNLFVIDLSPTDYERLTSYTELLADELVASVQEHAEQQRYVPGGPFHIDFRSRDELETGVFRVRPATAKRAPVVDGGEDSRGATGSGGSRGPDAPGGGRDADRRRLDHAEELRRAHPFRTSEAEAPAQGAAGLASHAASAAAGSLASTAAAARAGAAGPYADHAERSDALEPQVRDERGDHVRRFDDPREGADRYGSEPPGAAAAERVPAPVAPAVPPPVAPPPIDPAHRPWLDSDGDHYPLLGALTVLGRDPSADITLDDAGISRRHAEIRVTHDGPHFTLTVRDLGSTNGTFVNGDRITTRHLSDGDRLTLGRTSLVIRAGRR